MRYLDLLVGIVDVKILRFYRYFIFSFSRSSFIINFINKRSMFKECWIYRNTAGFGSIVEKNKLHEKSKTNWNTCDSINNWTHSWRRLQELQFRGHFLRMVHTYDILGVQVLFRGQKNLKTINFIVEKEANWMHCLTLRYDHSKCGPVKDIHESYC